MDDAAAAWVALVTGARSVRPVRSLSAGVTSELTVLDVDGRRLVLRRWDRADPTEQTPAGVTAEVRALTAGRAVLGPLVPEPVSPFSTSTTLMPRRLRSQAIPRPVAPPPTDSRPAMGQVVGPHVLLVISLGKDGRPCLQ